MMMQLSSFVGVGLFSLLTDVAPPVGPIEALSAGVLIVLGIGVVGVVGVSILVIWLIKKNRGPKNPS